jgi:homoserine kinase
MASVSTFRGPDVPDVPDVPQIVVPASIGNLGAGFDTLSVAVQLYTRVRVTEVRPAQPDTIETVFTDGTFSGENRIETAFRHARARLGRPTPGIRIEVTSDVPRGAGLGSSAAAAIAGLKLYEALTESRDAAEWLQLACEIEGHPDNAAAAMLGGIAASCQQPDGRVSAVHWRWPDAISFVVATPDVPLDTAYARSVLPAEISMSDAVFNLQRVVLFVRALETGRVCDLREAMRDRWHQPYRAPLVPALTEALALDHEGLLAVSLSGAGPSIVALVNDHAEDVSGLLRGLYDRLGVGVTVRILRAHQGN